MGTDAGEKGQLCTAMGNCSGQVGSLGEREVDCETKRGAEQIIE